MHAITTAPITSFPYKLYTLLERESTGIDNSGKSSSISWLDHGLSFKIMNAEKLSQELLPLYFKRKYR